MPYILTIGSKRSGEENCPKKKLEVSKPDAFPLLLAGTCERNHALVLTKRSPNAIPMNAVE